MSKVGSVQGRPNLSKLSNHYRTSVLQDSSRQQQKNQIRRKSVVSATSSFVSDRNGSFIRGALTKEDRGQSATFPDQPIQEPDSRKSVVLPEILEQPSGFEDQSSSNVLDLNFNRKIGEAESPEPKS